jgi:cytosine/uracil/thiamine/allantoin permease
MSQQDGRTYYLRAYFLWWAGMALLGSLCLNGPSKTFLGAIYNPVAWNAAGLLALLLAAWQTQYRSQIKRWLDHPLVTRACWVVFWGGQCLSGWERYQKKPEPLYGVAISILSLFTLCWFTNFVIQAYRTVREPKREAVPVASPS